MSETRWVTFDCFGTLVDWNTGFDAILRPVALDRTPALIDDDDLFARTEQSFIRPFDVVVTAERVRDYKPSVAHFRYFARSTGAHAGTWIHVARSWYHDIVPARELNVPRVWVNRELTSEDPTAASVRVTSAADVVTAVAALAAAPR